MSSARVVGRQRDVSTSNDQACQVSVSEVWRLDSLGPLCNRRKRFCLPLSSKPGTPAERPPVISSGHLHRWMLELEAAPQKEDNGSPTVARTVGERLGASFQECLVQGRWETALGMRGVLLGSRVDLGQSFLPNHPPPLVIWADDTDIDIDFAKELYNRLIWRAA